MLRRLWYKFEEHPQKQKILKMTGVVVVLLAFLSWLHFKTPRTLGALAYDANKQHGYTVYIEEETGYHPYLVLTKNYGKTQSVLLLRKYVLEEPQPFNIAHYRDSYYGRSYIDQYLNEDYLDTLSQDVRNQIRTSPVEIMALTAWGRNGRDVPEKEEIRRRVFLLSYIETALGPGKGYIQEGKALKYFKDYQARAVTTKADGTPSNWMLRTGTLGLAESNNVIGFELSVGIMPSRAPVGVRPAFCLNQKTKVVKSSEVIEGETVYVLMLE